MEEIIHEKQPLLRWKRQISSYCKQFMLLLIISLITAGLFAVRVSALTSNIDNDRIISLKQVSNIPGNQELQQFAVFFIDVGQGDSSLVMCDGHYMLIDGGRSKQSDKIYTFLKDKGVSHLDYIVATHPDDDHLGGLAGALNYADIDVALSPVLNDDSQSFQSFKKYLDQQGVVITIPKVGECLPLGSASVTILGPTKVVDSDNNNSLVLKVDYGDYSFLFTGDSEKEEETDILQTDAELKSTVLKVGHHGSFSSTNEEFLSAVNPVAAVISCGIDNEYGHPAEEVLERLKANNIQVLRTDLQGDILFYEDNGALFFAVERNPDADVYRPGAGIPEDTQHAPIRMQNPSSDGESEEETGVLRDNLADGFSDKKEMDYIVNTKTGKFHYPDCRGVKQMKESNKKYVTCDRQDLIKQGYDSCGICHP